MSTIYRGKINFTEDDLCTKYDKVKLSNSLKLNLNLDLNFSFFIGNAIKFSTDWNYHKKITKKVDIIRPAQEPTKLQTTPVHIIDVQDWLAVIDEEVEGDYYSESDDSYILNCDYCINATEDTHIAPSMEKDKLEFMNTVIQCILYGMKGGSADLDLCLGIRTSDPEFLLKVSLFCRREFNIRTISNYLLALAASLPQCSLYLKKYFNSCINLPTDWIEVAQQYMIIARSIKLPAQLRKVLISKFKEFSTYQIGKYQNKSQEVNLESKKIKLSLKSLIRTLHISEPVDHVMCLLGKTYPKSNEEYIASNLPGIWDQEKAGKRMKVPIPETWETQISINGNKPEVWEKLIDSKKLPYMATIRNIRNILQANVQARYHDKVAQSICQESKVINGKLLPFQYFTAFKVLEEYNDDILKANQKLTEIYTQKPEAKPVKQKGKVKKNASKNPNDKKERIRKIMRLRKIMGRPVVPENIIKKYTNALNKAVEISSIYNIPCIRGRVLILSNLSQEIIYSKFKYGSSKSVKEVVALLTSMCYFASEHAEIFLVKDNETMLYQLNKKLKSILTLSKDILKKVVFTKTTVKDLFDEMITKQRNYDHIVLFDINLPSDSLAKYTKFVNPFVSIFVNNIMSDVEETINGSNVLSISGFSEHSIKIISEQSNGGFIKKVDSIDKRYQLENNVLCFKEPENLSEKVADLCEQDEEELLTDINIFISSTFFDMDRERSLINKVIIPAVKKELKRKNISFLNINCIDLRWGVPAHFGCSEQMLKYCIDQVKRCHVFVGILGARYGWIPDDEILDNLSEIYPGLNEFSSHSITHIEYKLSPSTCHKIFFLKPLLDDTWGDINVEEFHNEIKLNEVYFVYNTDHLWNDFKILIPNLTRIVCENFVGGTISLPHVCIKHQRFTRQKMVKKSVCRLLKYSLKHFDSQKDEIKEIVTLLERDLKIKVKLYSDARKRDEPSNAKDKKNIPYIKECTDNFGGLVLIEGKIGSGRTSLMAGLIREFISTTYEEKYHISGKLRRKAFTWFYDTVKHISGENCNKITLYDLLLDMIDFLMLDIGYDLSAKLKHELGLYGDFHEGNEFWRPTNIRTALPIWLAILKIINMIENIQITFFLDGIEELSDSQESCLLNWIPSSLSTKIRFVITSVDDSSLSKCAKLRTDCVSHEMKSISTKFKRTVIENLLMTQGKCLESLPFSDHMSEITLKTDSDKPKYLDLAINYLLVYATFDKVKETIKSLPSTIEALIMYSLKSIEKEISKELCKLYFSFIYHSRCGLRNGDLQKLTSIYIQVAKKRNNFNLSRKDFSELKEISQNPGTLSLFPLLVIKNLSQLLLEEDRNQRIYIKDSTIKNVVKRYCESVNCDAIHYIISLYYDDLILRSSDEVAYRDIIYHKFQSKMIEDCLDLLTNIHYLKDRFQLRSSFGILEDYVGYGDEESVTKKQWLQISQNEKSFKDFKNFVYNNFELLTKNPELFTQQVLNEAVDSDVRLAYEHKVLSSYGFNESSNVMLKMENMDCQKERISSFVHTTNNKVTCISYSSKMKLIAVGCDSGLIQFYQSLTFQFITNLRQHTSIINDISFIESSLKMVSVGDDCKVSVWNARDGSFLQELNGHNRSVTGCVFCAKAEVICTTGLDAQCLLWKEDTHILHHTFKSGSPINCVTAHNSKILVGCWNGDMIIYNAFDLTRTAVIHNDGSVRSVSINPLYPSFLATTIDGHISIWNSNKGVKIKELSSSYHKYPTSSMFSSDGLKCIQYGGRNSQHQSVTVWSTAVGYHEYEKTVEDICCIDANSSFIGCGTQYGSVMILNSISFELIFRESVSDSELTAISFNSSKKSFINGLVVADYYCTVHLFEITDEGIIPQHKVERIHSRPIRSLAWSSCYIVSGSEDFSVNVMDLKDRSKENVISSIKDIFLNSILSVDIFKGMLLVGSKDKSIGLFSIKDKLILNVEAHAHNDWVTCVRFISSLSFISSSNDLSIKIWETTPAEVNSVNDCGVWIFSESPVIFTVLHTLTGHTSLLTCLSSDKCDIIASASTDGTIKLWQSKGIFVNNIVIDNNNGDLSGSRDSILWIKFHEKNGTLLALSSDNKLHIFNFNDRDCEINRLTHHMSPITGVIDIDDTLYTASLDTHVRQWHFNEILSNKKCDSYRIIDSVMINHHSGFNDVIVSFADSGHLIFWGRSVNPVFWSVIDKVDVKLDFAIYVTRSSFSSPYLSCQYLRRHKNDAIDIFFTNIILRYHLGRKTFEKVKPVTASQKDSLDNNQESQDGWLKLIHERTKKYFLRVKKTTGFLELLSSSSDMIKEEVITKVPLNGSPCHVSVYTLNDGDIVSFVAYHQGTVDFVVIKEILN